MSTVRKISDIIEGIEVVSENAIKKYGRSSRSRVRIFDMAKSYVKHGHIIKLLA